MSNRKWLAAFLAAAAAVAAALAVFNVVVDPFGVFGDRFFDWYEYDMTMNPRAAKIAYLQQHHNDYDSYIIGSSKAASISPDQLNGYTGGSFYNMTWYGGDLADERMLVRYLLQNYEVKNIVLTVDPQDAQSFDEESDPIKQNMHCLVDGSSPIGFYGKYLFAHPGYGADKLRAWRERGYLTNPSSVYIAETGVYNKQLRDNSRIGDMAGYLALEDNYYVQNACAMPHVDDALQAVRDIVDMCEDAGVSLTVVSVPLYKGDFVRYDRESFARFWTGLAEIHEFYDFWGVNCVTSDLRYFYDPDHFRNDVGTMMLAFIYGNDRVWMPEGFGRLTTAENAADHAAIAFAGVDGPVESYTARVPILMYHSVTEDPEKVSDTVALASDFDAQMRALAEAGYSAVTYGELMDFVELGTPLPEKPILISFDDGYRDNITVAAPILEKYGLRGTVSVIGVSVGKDTYKDTGVPMIPHFSLEEAAGYVRRGILDIASHSYDMHQVTERDGQGCRGNVLRFEGEDEAEYADALTADFTRSREQLMSALPVSGDVFTYPSGAYDTLSEVILHGLGARVTVTTDYGVNVVLKGIPQSLYAMKRINVEGGMSAGELLSRLDGLLSDTNIY